MPSKSRKKIKGQARKAKAAASKAKQQTTTTAVNNNNAQQQQQQQQQLQYDIFNDGTVISTLSQVYTTLTCTHGECRDIKCPDVVNSFLKEFYGVFFNTDNTLLKKRALDTAYNKYPEAVTNEQNLEIVKKNIIQNATSSLLKDKYNPHPMTMVDMIGYAATLMSIDSYDPSSHIKPGSFDQRDAKTFLRNLDITNGCERSLVKFFVNQIPCNCLDELYAQLKSRTKKMGMCSNCRQMKERSSLFICTGCERIQFCSKTCQLAFVPCHKEHCKVWQSG